VGGVDALVAREGAALRLQDAVDPARGAELRRAADHERPVAVSPDAGLDGARAAHGERRAHRRHDGGRARRRGHRRRRGHVLALGLRPLDDALDAASDEAGHARVVADLLPVCGVGRVGALAVREQRSRVEVVCRVNVIHSTVHCDRRVGWVRPDESKWCVWSGRGGGRKRVQSTLAYGQKESSPRSATGAELTTRC
jgi:hypothetical protein